MQTAKRLGWGARSEQKNKEVCGAEKSLKVKDLVKMKLITPIKKFKQKSFRMTELCVFALTKDMTRWFQLDSRGDFCHKFQKMFGIFPFN